MTGAFFGDGTDRWVCPNDRNLTLRAKLNTGWSMRTAQTNSQRRRDTLTVEEQEAIQDVMRKAECINVVEKTRIGWLVKRLENMQRKAIGDGLDHCLLCGEQIGFLRSTGALCETCQKNVCTKCGVKTMSRQHGSLWLCKICSEQREVWKRSGAWFFNKMPNYLIPSKTLPSRSSGPHSWISKAEGSSLPENRIMPMNLNHAYGHGKVTSYDSNSESESSMEGDALGDGPKQVKKTQSDSAASPMTVLGAEVQRLVTQVPRGQPHTIRMVEAVSGRATVAWRWQNGFSLFRTSGACDASCNPTFFSAVRYVKSAH
uniref:rab effector Noc2-like isoform X2 n=1 Tax=Myxine glutinosa TaxID=7769 RepID=UPI00358F3D80